MRMNALRTFGKKNVDIVSWECYTGSVMKKKLSASHLSDDCICWVNIENSAACVGLGRIRWYPFFSRRLRTISKESRINEDIRAKELRVIDSNGEMIGIISRAEALELADQRKLDLVEISPNAKPPVAKILDYGKYRYELQKREKEAKKKQKTIQVKEIRLSTFIEEHDIQVKAKTANKFLGDGDKVKVSLRFRGRERDYVNRGREVMNAFAEACSEHGVVDRKPSFEGRSLTMFLSPKPAEKQKKSKDKDNEK